MNKRTVHIASATPNRNILSKTTSVVEIMGGEIVFSGGSIFPCSFSSYSSVVIKKKEGKERITINFDGGLDNGGATFQYYDEEMVLGVPSYRDFEYKGDVEKPIHHFSQFYLAGDGKITITMLSDEDAIILKEFDPYPLIKE